MSQTGPRGNEEVGKYPDSEGTRSAPDLENEMFENADLPWLTRVLPYVA